MHSMQINHTGLKKIFFILLLHFSCCRSFGEILDYLSFFSFPTLFLNAHRLGHLVAHKADSYLEAAWIEIFISILRYFFTTRVVSLLWSLGIEKKNTSERRSWQAPTETPAGKSSTISLAWNIERRSLTRSQSCPLEFAEATRPTTHSRLLPPDCTHPIDRSHLLSTGR